VSRKPEADCLPQPSFRMSVPKPDIPDVENDAARNGNDVSDVRLGARDRRLFDRALRHLCDLLCQQPADYQPGEVQQGVHADQGFAA
jgi:hypothetical protein